jgi:hypothetical protein
MTTYSHIRDQRVMYLNGRRWMTAVLNSAMPGYTFRASYVFPDPGRQYANIPACWLTATAGMHGYQVSR